MKLQFMNNRNSGIDLWKGIAVIAVIVLHWPFTLEGTRFSAMSGVVHQWTRFAVPFFFIMAGYFAAIKRERSDESILHSLKKPLFLLWIAVVYHILYAVLEPMLDWNSIHDNGLARAFCWSLMSQVRWFIHKPQSYLLSGPGFHLWFLISLAFVLTLYNVIRIRLSATAWLCASVGCYVLECLSNHDTYGQLIPFRIPFSVLRPLLACSFFFLGIALANSRYHPSRTAAYGLLVSGLILHTLEAIIFTKVTGADIYQQANLAGTYLLAAGAALIALGYSESARFEPLCWIGQHSLHVYASHLAFLNLAEKVCSPGLVMLQPIISLILAVSWAAVVPSCAQRWLVFCSRHCAVMTSLFGTV